MYKIVFSLAVHERYECIIDLIDNINCFNSDCAIVIHLSKGFKNNSLISKELFLKLTKNNKNVYINPVSLETSLYSLLQVHLLNFDYISKKIEFEYFGICNSNDMFVKSGFESFISGYDCCLEWNSKMKSWEYYGALLNDNLSSKFNEEIKLKYRSYLEGTCYSKDLFSKIYETISKYDIHNHKFNYPAEEYLIPSLAMKYGKNIRNARGTKNGVGYLYVNRHIIKNVIRSKDKFAVKRINRDFYDYQRCYIRDVIMGNKEIYNTLGLKKCHKKYPYFKDILNSIISSIKMRLSKIKKIKVYLGKKIK